MYFFFDGGKFLWFKKRLGFFIFLELIYYKFVCMLMFVCIEYREGVEDVGSFFVVFGFD